MAWYIHKFFRAPLMQSLTDHTLAYNRIHICGELLGPVDRMPMGHRQQDLHISGLSVPFAHQQVAAAGQGR